MRFEHYVEVLKFVLLPEVFFGLMSQMTLTPYIIFNFEPDLSVNN